MKKLLGLILASTISSVAVAWGTHSHEAPTHRVVALTMLEQLQK